MKHTGFTLIEVVVALGILALSIAGLLSLLTSSQNRIGKSLEEWKNMHMLSQAAEYFMLQNEDPGAIEETFFPYRDYTVNVYYQDAEGLPEEYGNIVNQLPLTSLVIELRKAASGDIVDKLIIDRISYENTIQGE